MTTHDTTQHTPGPWLIYADESPIIEAFDNAQDFKVDIARLPDPYQDEIGAKEVNANAHLIASAPELLEACEAALGDLTQTVNFEEGDKQTVKVCFQLETAIAKARGNAGKEGNS